MGLCYSVKEASLFHVLTTIEEVIPGVYFCEPSEEKKTTGLIEVRELEFKMIVNEKDIKMRYTAKSLESTI